MVETSITTTLSDSVKPQASALSTTERRILLVTCFGHFMSHFNMLVFPAVLLPLAAKMNMDMADVMGLSFWMYLLFGLTALPWGFVADRKGAPPLLMLFFLCAGLSGFLAAFWIDQPVLFAVALASIGLFSGIYHPAGLGWISKEFDRVSLGMGYNGMFGNLGIAMAPLLAGIVNWVWSPQGVYLILGIMNLAGLGLMLIAPKSVKSDGKKGAGGRENAVVGAFMILLVLMMLGGIAYRGATVILPSYFELKNQGIFNVISSLAGDWLSGNMVATAIASFIYLVGMAGQYTGGHVAERYDLRYCYLAFHAVTVPAAFAMAVSVDVPLVFFAMIHVFFLLGMQPIENTLVARLTPKKFHSIAFGAKFILTFGVGALSVKMMKAIKLNYGIEMAFPALGIVSFILVLGILVLIYRTRNIQI